MKRRRTPIELTPDEIAQVRGWLVFEDVHLLAFNKPSGLSSQGGRIKSKTLDDLLWAFARSNGKRPELVHRLDRDTSGLILAAKNKPAAGFFGKALQAKRIKKTYLALVERAPKPAAGLIDADLQRQEIGPQSYMRVVEPSSARQGDAAPDAPIQPAQTRYRTLASNDLGAVVELSPLTGRMHQLRVHMASLGLPLLGDVRYGGAMTMGGHSVPRLMLHAAKLNFPHPDGERLTLEAPPPDDFAALAARISA